MNWETLSCPHRDGRYDGEPCTAGLLVQQGRSYGEPQARCNAWRGRVALREGTAYDGLQADRARCAMAVRACAAGHALRAPARLVQGDTDTGCAWRERVARPCRTGMLSWWHNGHVWACQRDALGSCVPTQAAPRPGATLSGATSGDAGVWGACAPGWRRGCACGIGTRDHASAALLLARVAPVTDDPLPLCTSD